MKAVKFKDFQTFPVIEEVESPSPVLARCC